MVVEPTSDVPMLQSSRMPQRTLSLAVTRNTYPPTAGAAPGQPYFSTMECCTPDTDRKIHASIVIVFVICRLGLSGACTESFTPSNCSAKPGPCGMVTKV